MGADVKIELLFLYSSLRTYNLLLHFEVWALPFIEQTLSSQVRCLLAGNDPAALT